MSNNYSNLAAYYDFIFPLNPLQVDFIKNQLPLSNSTTMLDLGCGTGSIAIELAESGASIIGIDIDAGMVAAAQQKSKSKNPTFIVEDITKINRSFKASSFDVIFSFGNSLVHLPNSEAIEELFHNVRNLLKPNGVFMGQIINYRRIFDKIVTGLPTIDNEYISFERAYQFSTPGNPLTFKTRLLTKENGNIIENSEILYPLLPEEALFMLDNAGFFEIETYGAFNRDALASDSYSFIFAAR